MNFNRISCFSRALKRYRTFRGKVRESIATGCAEKFDAEFARWILIKGRTPKRKRHYREIVRKYPDKTTVIKNQRELEKFMALPFAEA